MAQQTGIEWTDMSSNPIRAVRKSDGKRGHACVHASPGCLHCYSERWNGWRGTGLKFNAPALKQVDIILDYKELTRMCRIPAGKKCFVCDMTDLFGPFVPDKYIIEVFRAMSTNAGAVYQVLTKRPGRMASWTNQYYPGGLPPNIWCGASVEDQKWANERIPLLLRVPARVRFLSCEPLLGPLDLSHYLIDDWTRIGDDVHWHEHPPIHWLIAGGESGHGARPMHPDWARSLRDQCAAAGVPFFFKQWGEYEPYEEDAQPPFWRDQHGQLHDGHWLNILDPETGEMGKGWHEDSLITPYAFRRVGKHAAGRLLDGVEHNAYPA